jgi:glycerophosphoryl diester phosphodiesterase
VQSFEIANLKYLRSKLGKRANLRLMQLVAPGEIRPSDVALPLAETTVLLT